MRVKLLTISMMITLLFLSAMPASAIHMNDVSLTADCDSYTITVTGATFRSVTADYSLTLTPISGSPIQINGSFEIIYPPKYLSSTYTDSWNEKLCDEYTITGSISLVSYDLTPITTWDKKDFNPVTINCECYSYCEARQWKLIVMAMEFDKILICNRYFSKEEIIAFLENIRCRDRQHPLLTALKSGRFKYYRIAVRRRLINFRKWCGR